MILLPMGLSAEERPRICAAMRRSHIGTICVALISVVAASCYINRIPDLSAAEAAEIISRAPEFNRYARLVKIESVHHEKESMDSQSVGKFTFLYLNSPADAPLIKANVDFRYHEGKWYLNGFSYGCPADCHFVNVSDGPPGK
jgi:hypothetical protein